MCNAHDIRHVCFVGKLVTVANTSTTRKNRDAFFFPMPAVKTTLCLRSHLLAETLAEKWGSYMTKVGQSHDIQMCAK